MLIPAASVTQLYCGGPACDVSGEGSEGFEDRLACVCLYAGRNGSNLNIHGHTGWFILSFHSKSILVVAPLSTQTRLYFIWQHEENHQQSMAGSHH